MNINILVIFIIFIILIFFITYCTKRLSAGAYFNITSDYGSLVSPTSYITTDNECTMFMNLVLEKASSLKEINVVKVRNDMMTLLFGRGNYVHERCPLCPQLIKRILKVLTEKDYVYNKNKPPSIIDSIKDWWKGVISDKKLKSIAPYLGSKGLVIVDANASKYFRSIKDKRIIYTPIFEYEVKGIKNNIHNYLDKSLEYRPKIIYKIIRGNKVIKLVIVMDIIKNSLIMYTNDKKVFSVSQEEFKTTRSLKKIYSPDIAPIVVLQNSAKDLMYMGNCIALSAFTKREVIFATADMCAALMAMMVAKVEVVFFSSNGNIIHFDKEMAQRLGILRAQQTIDSVYNRREIETMIKEFLPKGIKIDTKAMDEAVSNVLHQPINS